MVKPAGVRWVRSNSAIVACNSAITFKTLTPGSAITFIAIDGPPFCVITPELSRMVRSTVATSPKNTGRPSRHSKTKFSKSAISY